jgi:glyoxylase-like metal-dependent hydrolase (beta-lactamase superfamily II)
MDWSIWVFCYATGRLPYDFVAGSPVMSNKGLVDIPMIVSMLKSTDGELVMVDTGFASGASMTGRNFQNFVRSDALVAGHGFDPAAVRKLVLTHLHFDHAGNVVSFPNARIYVQRYEYDAWKAVIEEYGAEGAGKDQWAFSSLSLDDFVAFDAARAEGRVVFLDGDAEVAPGIVCRLARDTHTFGSQWLDIATARGRYVLCGDIAYTFHNLERMWPPGYIQGNAWNMMRTFKEMKAAVDGDLSRLVPGHDIELFRRNPVSEKLGNPFIELHLAKGEASLVA